MVFYSEIFLSLIVVLSVASDQFEWTQHNEANTNSTCPNQYREWFLVHGTVTGGATEVFVTLQQAGGMMGESYQPIKVCKDKLCSSKVENVRTAAKPIDGQTKQYYEIWINKADLADEFYRLHFGREKYVPEDTAPFKFFDNEMHDDPKTCRFYRMVDSQRIDSHMEKKKKGFFSQTSDEMDALFGKKKKGWFF